MNSNESVNELMRSILPFGYLDLQAAAELLEEARVSFNDFSSYVEEFALDTGVEFDRLDICGLAYEYILQQARQEIEDQLAIDICNSTDIYVY